MTLDGDEDGPAEPQISGRRWRKARRSSADRALPSYAGLGARVETILRLAEVEASEIREEARQAAAALIEKAEQDAAQIRADAVAEATARATGAGGEEQC